MNTDRNKPRKLMPHSLGAWVPGSLLLASSSFAQDKLNYEEHILPLFRNECFNCHNANDKKGDLDLTTFTGLMSGSSTGTVVTSGDPDTSSLYLSITHTREPVMPPRKKLSDAQISQVKKWIEGGLLENSAAKPIAAAKARVKLALAAPSAGRPEGPPPLPLQVPLESYYHTPRANAVTAMTHSPWAPVLATAGQRQILLYNTQSLELVGILPFPEGFPKVLRFSRNGKLLLAAGGLGAQRGYAVLFDLETGDRITRMGDEFDTILTADLSPDQSMVVIGTTNKMVRVFSTETGELLYEIKKHTDWVLATSFSPDGVLLATADRNGGLLVWEARTGELFYDLRGHTAAVSAVSWRPDSNVLASASEDTTLRLWNMHDGAQIKSVGAHGGGATDVAFAQDGRLVSSGRDNTVKLWSAEAEGIRSFAMPDMTLSVAISDDGQRVIGGDFAGNIHVFKHDDGAGLGALSSNPLPIAARIQQQQQRVAELTAQLATFGQDAAEHAAVRQAVVTASGELDTTRKQLEALVASLPQHEAVLKQAAANLVAAEAELAPLIEKKVQIDASLASFNQAVATAQATEKLAAENLAAAPADETAQKQASEQLAAAKQSVAAALAALENGKRDAAEHQALVDSKSAARVRVAEARTQADAQFMQAKAEHERLTAALPTLEARAKEASARAAELDQTLAARAAAETNIHTLQAAAVYTQVYASRALLAQRKQHQEQAAASVAATHAELTRTIQLLADQQKALAEAPARIEALQTQLTLWNEQLPTAKAASAEAQSDLPLKQARFSAQSGAMEKLLAEARTRQTALDKNASDTQATLQQIAETQSQVKAKADQAEQALAMSNAKTAEMAGIQLNQDAKVKQVEEAATRVAAMKQSLDQALTGLNTKAADLQNGLAVSKSTAEALAALGSNLAAKAQAVSQATEETQTKAQAQQQALAVVKAKSEELKRAQDAAAQDPNNPQLAEQVVKLAADLQAVQVLSTQADEQFVQAQQALATLRTEQAALAAQVPTAEKQSNEASTAVTRLQAEHRQLVEAHRTAEASHQAAVIAHSTLDGERNALAQSLARLKEEIASLVQSANALRQEQQALAENIPQLQAGHGVLVNAVPTLKAEHQGVADLVASAQINYKQTEQDLAAAQAIAAEKANIVNDLTGQATAASQSLEQLKATLVSAPTEIEKAKVAAANLRSALYEAEIAAEETAQLTVYAQAALLEFQSKHSAVLAK